MLNDGRFDAFVSQGERNRPVAGIEFEDGPDRGAYLLALHVSGIIGNTQSTEPFAMRQSTRSLNSVKERRSRGALRSQLSTLNFPARPL